MRDSDVTGTRIIIDRLDQAAKRLKEKRAAQLQDNKEDDTAVPATSNLGAAPSAMSP